MKKSTVPNKRTFVIVLAIVLVSIILTVIYCLNAKKSALVKSISNYDECVAAGFPIMESYPEQCKTSDGRTFVNTLSQSVGMANPASVYCRNVGGMLEIKDETAGQVGYCTLPGGKICEEWALFRGECQ